MTTHRDPRPARRRLVRVQLDHDRHALLQQLAHDADVTAEQLAGIWVRERLDGAASALSLATIGEHALGSAHSAAAGSSAEGSRRTSLHTAIVDVLEEHGGPMTAAQIAEAIRARGSYRSPRSGQPITGAAISRRVANPYYRNLFERDGRRLDLARRARSDSG